MLAQEIESKVIKRKLVKFPVPVIRCIGCIGRLEDATSVISDASTLGLNLHIKHGSSRTVVKDDLDSLPLQHDLSDRALRRLPKSLYDARKTPHENVVFEKLFPLFEYSIQSCDAEAFVRVLVLLGGEFYLGNTGFRTRNVYLAPDIFGVSVRFPNKKHIAARVMQIHGFIRMHTSNHPLFTAIVVQAVFLNIHPFYDANGRSARVLFNWIMRYGKTSLRYIPLYELFWYSKLGWEIRLRLVETTGNWNDLCQYFINLGEMLRNKYHLGLG